MDDRPEDEPRGPMVLFQGLGSTGLGEIRGTATWTPPSPSLQTGHGLRGRKRYTAASPARGPIPGRAG